MINSLKTTAEIGYPKGVVQTHHTTSQLIIFTVSPEKLLVSGLNLNLDQQIAYNFIYLLITIPFVYSEIALHQTKPDRKIHNFVGLFIQTTHQKIDLGFGTNTYLIDAKFESHIVRVLIRGTLETLSLFNYKIPNYNVLKL